MTVARIDALALSGGSAFGLDAAGGAMAWLHEQGRGVAVGAARVPIVPGAALFDLENGGDKAWGRRSPYFELGFAAAASRRRRVRARQRRRRLRRDDLRSQGRPRLGERDHLARLCRRRARRGQFGRARDARADAPFLGRALRARRRVRRSSAPAQPTSDALALVLKRDELANTTLAIVATDAPLDKAQATRVARMASAGFALALRPAHAPADGDVVFAASTARAARAPDLRDLTEIGMLAAECLARAIARGVYEATPLPFAGRAAELEGEVGAVSAGPAHRLLPNARQNRSARNGAGSTIGVSPLIICASSRPLTGPSVSPRCWWPKSNHRPLWRGAGPITGSMSGRQGRRPSQGAGSSRSPSGNISRAERLEQIEMGRRSGIVAAGEFGAGGEANAARHRRQQIAAFEIEHRPAERGAAAARCSACGSRA